MILLTNRTYPNSDIESLGYGLSVAKPSLVDNGPVLFEKVKPITDWNRYFFDGEVASISGRLSTSWMDGSREKASASRTTTLLSNENSRRWLPGTPTSWNTGSTFSTLWLGGSGVSDFDSLRLAAIAKAKSEGWDLGTLYAERRQTVEMLKYLIKNFMSLAKRILRSFSSYAEMQRFLKQRGDMGAGNNWLLLRYGLRPLVFDILEAYERLTRVHNELFRVSETTSSTKTDELVFDPGILSGVNLPSGWTHAGGIPANPLKGTGTMVTMRNISAKCGVGVQTVVSGKFTVNGALTLWELVPFSFVVDWVLNIGDNIVAWSPTFDRSLKYAWITIREELTMESTADFSGTNLYAGLAKPTSQTTNLFYRGRSTSTLRCNTVIFAHSYKRVKLDLADVPYGLDTRFNLDWWKTLDIAAMLSQQRSEWAKLIRKLKL